jgi:hypothetical protein
MRGLCRLPVLPRLGMTLAFLLLMANEANADLTVNNIGLYGGGSTPINPGTTIVEIQFTGNTGAWVYGDAQTATNWTNPGGSAIPLYCIALAKDNVLGSGYGLTPWTNPYSFTADVYNRIAWAADSASLAGYGPAAAQLLIWSLTDANFKVINWDGHTSLHTAYDSAVGSMNSDYNSQTHYQAQFFDAVHQPTISRNQDLVLGGGGTTIETDVLGAPEPSTLVIAGLGALGLIGFGCRRRRPSAA